MDDDQGPSEDESSEATVLPAGGSWEGISPVDPRDDNVVATLDMDYQLDPEFKWLCVGKHRETGEPKLVTVPDGSWDYHELLGFSVDVADTLVMIIKQSRGQ